MPGLVEKIRAPSPLGWGPQGIQVTDESEPRGVQLTRHPQGPESPPTTTTAKRSASQSNPLFTDGETEAREEHRGLPTCQEVQRPKQGLDATLLTPHPDFSIARVCCHHRHPSPLSPGMILSEKGVDGQDSPTSPTTEAPPWPSAPP